MHQRDIPKSIWLVTLMAAVLLGIWPGVGLGQEHWIFFGALFGWLTFPATLYALLTQNFGDNSVFWSQFLAACGYPLAMLGYCACAYWVMQRTSAKRKGLLLVSSAACVSTLASIPAAIITMSMNQDVHTVNFFSGYLPALPIHGIILIHLLISALLGWWIALGIIRCYQYMRSRFSDRIEASA